MQGYTYPRNSDKINVILTILMVLPFSMFAQSSDLGSWFLYFGDRKINNKWNWHHEVQYRNYNFIGDTDQLLLRTGLGYNLTENNNNLLLGYAYIHNRPYIAGTNQKSEINENRIYQQFITRQSFGRLAIQHRYRFEQRFFDDDFRLRVRYFLSLNIALTNKTIIDKTLYLSAYNEIFLNTEQSIFDRNRLYMGIGYRISARWKTEIGLMNQSTNNVSRNQLNFMSFHKF